MANKRIFLVISLCVLSSLCTRYNLMINKGVDYCIGEYLSESTVGK